MHKRIVASYVKDQLKKGKTIENIRKELLKDGYKKEDVDEVLRDFEYRETDLRIKGEQLAVKRTNVHILLGIILFVTFVNVAFFVYYFSNPSYVLLKELPPGFMVMAILFLAFWIAFCLYFYLRKR